MYYSPVLFSKFNMKATSENHFLTLCFTFTNGKFVFTHTLSLCSDHFFVFMDIFWLLNRHFFGFFYLHVHFFFLQGYVFSFSCALLCFFFFHWVKNKSTGKKMLVEPHTPESSLLNRWVIISPAHPPHKVAKIPPITEAFYKFRIVYFL